MTNGKIKCRLCGSEENKIVYEGPIRSGGVGSGKIDGYSYHSCSLCGLVFIYPEPEGLDSFYETEEYRKSFFEEVDVASHQKRYDSEQSQRVYSIGIENLRNKTIADFGAGPGLFLDSIQGVAAKTIAVEPSKIYREYFLSKGHKHFFYADELEKSGEKIDVAVSFDAIEHISDINGFVNQIYNVMNDKGTFYVSMPNHDDIIRMSCSESYEPFFYQVAHINYFNRKSIEYLLTKAGFKEINIGFIHKYDMSNLLQWCRFGKPGKFECSSYIDKHFHKIYVEEVIRMGIASHLFVQAKKII